jgi:2-phosphosulfolactate phosphatase
LGGGIEHNMSMTEDRIQVRCEWGESAARLLAPESDVIVIVDVLSFSTCVDVAVSRGGRVFPYKPEAPGASTFAEERRAHLALPRGQGRFSLSPTTFRDLEPGESVVLPSPNGAMAALSAATGLVLAGCLRNALAVANACMRKRRILVVPAGERWPDGSLRPCLEDWLGAGAILSHLKCGPSGEACAAIAAFRELKAELPQALRSCMSGRELIERGYPEDVEIAAELESSPTVPMYDGEAFTGGRAAAQHGDAPDGAGRRR